MANIVEIYETFYPAAIGYSCNRSVRFGGCNGAHATLLEADLIVSVCYLEPMRGQVSGQTSFAKSY